MPYIQGNRVLLSALTAGEIELYQGAAEGLIRLVSSGGGGLFIAGIIDRKCCIFTSGTDANTIGNKLHDDAVQDLGTRHSGGDAESGSAYSES